MSAVNLKELARRLNLSTSTVSRALNNKYDISSDTKKKVAELAEKLNYQPNPHARSLRKQNSKTMAVVVPEITNSFFSLAINGIQSVAREKGYHVLVYVTNENDEIERESLRHLQSGRTDGLLISVSNTKANDEQLQQIREKGIPLVFFDRVRDEFDTVKVTTDDFEIAFKGTEHLISQGCRKIAYLQISKALSIGQNRLRGHLEALKKHNITEDSSMVVECCHNQQDNYGSIAALFTRKNRPDSVFASVEHLAITTYKVCNDLNLKIPQQVKVISFSNLEAASLLSPSLTSIAQPAYEIGRQAASHLLQALTKKGFKLRDTNIVLPSQLIVRRSTARS